MFVKNGTADHHALQLHCHNHNRHLLPCTVANAGHGAVCCKYVGEHTFVQDMSPVSISPKLTDTHRCISSHTTPIVHW